MDQTTTISMQAAAVVQQQAELPGIREVMECVERRLEQAVRCDGASTAAIMAYLGQTRGKRLRPALVVVWHDVFADLDQPRSPVLVDTATTVELVHLASLLHDDLVDGAAERRGMPTVASQWGGAAAVLAGDFLFASAFGMLVGGGQYHALGALARALRDMSEAEVEQLSVAYRVPASGETAEETYWRCVRGKTGSLFAAACEAGAVAGGAEGRYSSVAKDFGMLLGSAFQVTDDLLDYTGDPARLGKPTGQDLARGLLTLPAARLLAGGGPVAAQLREGLSQHHVPANLIKQVQEAVVSGGAAAYTRDAVRGLLQQAGDCLALLPARQRARADQLLAPVLGALAAREC